MSPDLVPNGALAITKSDTTVYSPALVGFVVGAAGNVAIVDVYGVTTTIAAIVGTPIHVRCVKIMSANTTATGIVGLVA